MEEVDAKFHGSSAREPTLAQLNSQVCSPLYQSSYPPLSPSPTLEGFKLQLQQQRTRYSNRNVQFNKTHRQTRDLNILLKKKKNEFLIKFREQIHFEAQYNTIGYNEPERASELKRTTQSEKEESLFNFE